VRCSRIIGSRPFKFIVGPEHKSVTVHAALVADHSAPLAVLINGPMCEAKDGIATLDDIDEQTFVRFCEYAYMGDYTSAQNEIVPLTPDVVSKTSPLIVAGQDFFKISSSKKKKKDRSSFALDVPDDEPYCGRCNHGIKQNLWDEFQSRDYSVISPRFRPCENTEKCKITLVFSYVTLEYMSSLTSTTSQNCASWH